MSFRDELEEELGRRIKIDMEPQGKWNEDVWKTIEFGDYYGNDDLDLPVIHNLVEQTVDTVLGPDFQMKSEAIEGLRTEIKAGTTPEDALDPMEEAAANVEPRPPDAAPAKAKKKKKAAMKKSANKKAGKKKEDE